jgi:uncharacterized protein (DUF427 family)
MNVCKITEPRIGCVHNQQTARWLIRRGGRCTHSFEQRVLNTRTRQPVAKARATWNGVTLAESDDCIVVEGNYYFPTHAVNRQYLRESATHTMCYWKGTASYYDVVVDRRVNKDAAWYYPYPKPAADQIKAYIAFWRGIRVEH